MGTIFQFVFGCGHRHLSAIFTIKKRTYRVCLDCGHESDYSGPLMPYMGREASTAPLSNSHVDAYK